VRRSRHPGCGHDSARRCSAPAPCRYAPHSHTTARCGRHSGRSCETRRRRGGSLHRMWLKSGPESLHAVILAVGPRQSSGGGGGRSPGSEGVTLSVCPPRRGAFSHDLRVLKVKVANRVRFAAEEAASCARVWPQGGPNLLYVGIIAREATVLWPIAPPQCVPSPGCEGVTLSACPPLGRTVSHDLRALEVKVAERVRLAAGEAVRYAPGVATRWPEVASRRHHRPRSPGVLADGPSGDPQCVPSPGCEGLTLSLCPPLGRTDSHDLRALEVKVAERVRLAAGEAVRYAPGVATRWPEGASRWHHRSWSPGVLADGPSGDPQCAPSPGCGG